MMNSSTRLVSVSCRHRYVAATTLVVGLVKKATTTTTRMQIRCYIPPAYRNTKRLVLVKPRARVAGFLRGGRVKRIQEKESIPTAAVVVNERGSGSVVNGGGGGGGSEEKMYEAELRRISDGEVSRLQYQKHSLMKLLRVYRQILLYNEGEDHVDIPPNHTVREESSSLVEHLMTIQKQTDGTSLLPATTETLVQSEELFRSMCSLLQDMVLEWAQHASRHHDSFSMSKLRYLFGEDPQSVAEELLLALVEIRKDRAGLVNAAVAEAKEPTIKETTSVMKNIRTLVGKFLGVTPKQDDSKVNKHKVELIAHSNPQFGPQSNQLGAVLQNMALQEQGEGFDLLKHAERMTQILEKSMADHVVTLDPGILEFVLQTWVKVGTLRASQEAERLFSKYDAGRKEWNSSLLLVLRAFRSVAMTEKSKEKRRLAVEQARELVVNKAKTLPQKSSSPTQERLRMQAFITLLESYQNAGIDAIPDVGEQARALMRLLMDASSFNLLDGKDKWLSLGSRRLRPNYVPDLDFLDAVIFTYAMTDQRDFILRAVRLLHIVLDRRQRTPWSRVVPTAPCIDKVIHSLCHIERTDYRDADKMLMAIFGLKMMDVLYTTDHQLPLLSTFTSIMQILETSKSPNAAATAEELLSRWELRAAVERKINNNNNNANHDLWINRSVYHSVLRCWSDAAHVHPGSAAKALKLLEKMEAQSSPYPPSLALAPAVQEIVAKVYNDAVRPDEETYLLVLQTCFNTKIESEKEEALKIAHKVFCQMPQRGIKPSENARNIMRNGCTLLMPDDPQQSAELVRNFKKSLETAD